MKYLKQTALMVSVLLSWLAPASAKPAPTNHTAYDFRFDSIDGSPLLLSAYRGKVVMVVNTASECGLTPQYAKLQALYERYAERGLVVLGVPSNDFGGQEPGKNSEIKKFCELNYGVTFPLTSKVTVSGKDAHPFYAWARETLGAGTSPKWNFHKYLIDKNGRLVDYFGSMTAPDSGRVITKIEQLLSE